MFKPDGVCVGVSDGDFDDDVDEKVEVESTVETFQWRPVERFAVAVAAEERRDTVRDVLGLAETPRGAARFGTSRAEWSHEHLPQVRVGHVISAPCLVLDAHEEVLADGDRRPRVLAFLGPGFAPRVRPGDEQGLAARILHEQKSAPASASPVRSVRYDVENTKWHHMWVVGR